MGQIRRFLARYEVAVGLVVTLACSLGGQWLVTLPGLSLVGALVLALLLGMALQGVTSLRDAARQSTPFIANKFLRAGIILLGFKLNLILLMGAGMKSLLAAIVVVTVMVTLNYVVARRLFGVEHTLAVLTACGSSICGAAAVMGVAGAAKAKADDSVLAVACVAILGTAFTLVLVALQPVLGFSAAQFGTLAGLSLHEIAHAVAAGGAAGAVGTDAAIVAKLSRVLLLAPVAVLVGVLEARRAVVAKRQAALAGVSYAHLRNGKGAMCSILLDFGTELQGGLQIVTGQSATRTVKLRIRFGESAQEAMCDIDGKNGATNDHAMRDFTLEVPWLGVAECGNSGFRFARIDVLGDNTDLLLQEVRAAFRYRDIPYLGSFECDNERLNKIWQTGAYTVHLNMQQYLWDGIKRDRLVWTGDINPEVLTIATVFGANDVVNKSLDLSKKCFGPTQWMCTISSYSIWWMIKSSLLTRLWNCRT